MLLLQLLVLVAVTLTVTGTGVDWGIIPCIVFTLCATVWWRTLESTGAVLQDEAIWPNSLTVSISRQQ